MLNDPYHFTARESIKVAVASDEIWGSLQVYATRDPTLLQHIV